MGDDDSADEAGERSGGYAAEAVTFHMGFSTVITRWNFIVF